jgi:hypothetical protein
MTNNTPSRKSVPAKRRSDLLVRACKTKLTTAVA